MRSNPVPKPFFPSPRLPKHRVVVFAKRLNGVACFVEIIRIPGV